MSDPYRTAASRPADAGVVLPTGVRLEVKLPTVSECTLELAHRLEQDPSPENIAAAVVAMRQNAELIDKALALLEKIRDAAPRLPVPSRGRRGLR